ncbi:BCCT family transporter [Dermabacteraceae bacterium TAE3-ERU27]|nr:BCCT family transporter [Dermabacteraceae bacterium TAE3-ERU27]
MSANTTTTATPPTEQNQYGLSRSVFGFSAAIIAVCLALALIWPAGFNSFVSGINTTVVNSIGWYYVLLVTGFVVFALALAFSRLGTVPLGEDDSEPEYDIFAWFAMLFAAGMGIGLVFWGAAEPLNYLTDKFTPPGVQYVSQEAHYQRAMTQTFLHWGIHAWAIYVVVGLSVAYAVHRRGRPVSIRWALEPVLGRHTNSWIGDAIDITAIVGTLVGVATSLGFGINQIAAGLEHLGVLHANPTVKVFLVVGITALATISVVAGLDKGIKFLSNLNMALAALLLVLVLVLGPTLFLLREFVAGIGSYIQNFVSLSFQTFPFFGEEGESWLGSWTTYYWGWWIAWSPFVGVFIARISKGRTVREFIVGVLLVPTLITILWFTVMGGTAIFQETVKNAGLIEEGTVNTNTAMFDMLSNLPGGAILSGIAIILVTVFFVTSADSGAFVVDMIAHQGDPLPPRATRTFWAVLSGVIAAVLIAVDGDGSGMGALQALTILAAAPFSVVMLFMCVSTFKALKREIKIRERIERQLVRERLVSHVSDRLADQVSEELADKVSDGLMEQVADKVADQMVEQQASDEFMEQVADRVADQMAEQHAASDEFVEQVADKVADRLDESGK